MTTLPDAAFLAGLTRLHRAYSGLLSVEVRDLTELTPAEILLESRWRMELEPVLNDMYWWPLRNGLERAPENEDDLREWLLLAFLMTGSTTALNSLLRRYQVRGVNIGGVNGLELLGIGGGFNLTNRRYRQRLDDHADMLTTAGTEMSLIDTTVNNLAQWIPAARASADNTLLTLGRLIAANAAVRSVSIAVTELSRVFTRGQTLVYGRNEVAYQRYVARANACLLCRVLHGQVMPVNNIPPDLLIPRHSNCQCSYEPVTDGWEQPETIWRGE